MRRVKPAGTSETVAAGTSPERQGATVWISTRDG